MSVNSLTDELFNIMNRAEASVRRNGEYGDGSVSDRDKVVWELMKRIKACAGESVKSGGPTLEAERMIKNCLAWLPWGGAEQPLKDPEWLRYVQNNMENKKAFMKAKKECDRLVWKWDAGRAPDEDGKANDYSRIIIEAYITDSSACSFCGKISSATRGGDFCWVVAVRAFTKRKAREKIKIARPDNPGEYHPETHSATWRFAHDVESAFIFAERLSEDTGIPLGKLKAQEDIYETLEESINDDDEMKELRESILVAKHEKESAKDQEDHDEWAYKEQVLMDEMEVLKKLREEERLEAKSLAAGGGCKKEKTHQRKTEAQKMAGKKDRDAKKEKERLENRHINIRLALKSMESSLRWCGGVGSAKFVAVLKRMEKHQKLPHGRFFSAPDLHLVVAKSEKYEVVDGIICLKQKEGFK